MRQHVLDREGARPIGEAESQVLVAVTVGVAGNGEEIGERDARREADGVVRPAAFDDDLVALALVDQVEIIAFAAAQCVVACPAGHGVVEIGAANVIGTGRPREIGQPQEVRSAEPGSVGELEPFDLRGVVDVGCPHRSLRQHVLDGEAAGAVGETEGQVVMRVAIGVARNRKQIGEGDAAREADRIAGAAGLDDAVVALVLVDEVEIVTRTAGHRIVAIAAHQDVAARAAGEGIIPVIADGGPGLRKAQRLAGTGSFKELSGFQNG
ncbi:hypothetical protein SDC9_62678 [bioreactor metagenome]|uniref:Uncharacterized protein n=1 Tax=bioreactor metagenome TaxID=1076179 RepID=A0A644XJD9_9ZZZZ